MNNGNQNISELRTEVIGQLLKGTCKVNGVSVSFYYHPKSDKFTATSLLNEDYDLFKCNGNDLQARNWKYLICGSIADAIKKSIN